MDKTLTSTGEFTAIGETIAAPTSIFGTIFGFRRRRIERERMAQSYNQLIESADDHILRDLGVTREDLFRMREDLYK